MSSVDQRGSNEVDKDNRANKQGTGACGLFIAFLTGAGVATTAILIASKALTPKAERILKKCNRAFEALDSQIAQAAVIEPAY